MFCHDFQDLSENHENVVNLLFSWLIQIFTAPHGFHVCSNGLTLSTTYKVNAIVVKGVLCMVMSIVIDLTDLDSLHFLTFYIVTPRYLFLFRIRVLHVSNLEVVALSHYQWNCFLETTVDLRNYFSSCKVDSEWNRESRKRNKHWVLYFYFTTLLKLSWGFTEGACMHAGV
jgi:hypothetical protein